MSCPAILLEWIWEGAFEVDPWAGMTATGSTAGTATFSLRIVPW